MPRSIQEDAILHRGPARLLGLAAGTQEQYDLYSQLANVESVSNEYSMNFHETDLPPVSQVFGDLTPTPEADFKVSDPYIVHQLNFRLAYGYTRRAERYDNYALIGSKAAGLSKSSIHTMNVVASMPSIYAEAGQTWGWAAETLGNNAHAMIGSSATYDNLFPAAAPGAALYRDIINYASSIPSEESFKMRVEIESIEVGSTNYEDEWYKFFESRTEIGQDNPEVINPMLRRGRPNIIFNPYMGSTTRQIVRLRGHRINLEVGMQPTMESWGIEDPAGIKHRVEFDCNIGVSDMRLIIVIAAA